MATTYLKKAIKNASTGEDDTREIVSNMLKEIEAGGEERCVEYAKNTRWLRREYRCYSRRD